MEAMRNFEVEAAHGTIQFMFLKLLSLRSRLQFQPYKYDIMCLRLSVCWCPSTCSCHFSWKSVS